MLVEIVQGTYRYLAHPIRRPLVAAITEHSIMLEQTDYPKEGVHDACLDHNVEHGDETQPPRRVFLCLCQGELAYRAPV